MGGRQKDQNVEEIIRRSVNAAVSAASRAAKDTFKATERRLYGYPYLKQKLADDLEMLEELESYGPREKSRSITRYIKNGVRLTPEEIYDAVHLDMEATIAADQEEVERMEKALSYIKGDRYYLSVEGRYFLEQDDEEIAQKLGCDTSTVWRNRKRLVQRVSIMLYGAQAL